MHACTLGDLHKLLTPQVETVELSRIAVLSRKQQEASVARYESMVRRRKVVQD